MKYINRFVYDKELKNYIYVIGEQNNKYFVIYYWNDGDEMQSSWWDIDPLLYYKKVDSHEVPMFDKYEYIKYIFSDNFWGIE